LEEVEIPPLFVEVESIKSIIVPAEGHLVYRLFAGHLVLLFQINEAEVVFPDATADSAKILVGLGDKPFNSHT